MEFPDVSNSETLRLTLSDTAPIVEVIEWLSTVETTDVDVLIPKSIAKHVRRDFPLNSKVAELIKQDGINLYSTEVTPLPTTIVEDDGLYYFVRFGEVEQFVTPSSDEIPTTVVEEFHRLLETGEQIQIDILPWSDLLSQLEEMVDIETRQEFERLIEAARIKNLGALDDISVAIIAAAQSGALLNDLSTWAEEVGLASKATFSRRKSDLEDDGVIYTEKVPIDVGRPKLRLKLADDISAVRVKGEEIDISREKTGAEPTTSEPDGSSETEVDEISRTAAQDEKAILATIEEEVQEAISSN